LIDIVVSDGSGAGRAFADGLESTPAVMAPTASAAAQPLRLALRIGLGIALLNPRTAKGF
jgi:hypothetical protein